MSRSGNVWDNAAMESFFSSLKTERTGQHRALLQLQRQALDDRLSKPYGVRTRGGIRLTACQLNRVQAISRKTDNATKLLMRQIVQLVDGQFSRFLMIGCLNTAVGYGLFAAFILLGLPSALALLIATVIGVLFNYWSTGRLVFARRASSRLWLFVLCYAVIYVVNRSFVRRERMSVPALLPQALLSPPIVGLAFLLNKYLVFISPRTVRS